MTLDRHLDRDERQRLLQVMGIEFDQQAALAAVDVDLLQVHDRAFDVNRHGLACSQWTGATHEVAAVTICGLGIAGGHGLDLEDAGHLLGGDLLVAVHEHDKRLDLVGLQQQGLDHDMLVHAQFASRDACATAFFVGIGYGFEVDFVLNQGPDGLGLGDVFLFAHATMIPLCQNLAKWLVHCSRFQVHG